MSNKPISLDDLVKANKTQFDTIFSKQMDESDLRDTTHASGGQEKSSGIPIEEELTEPSQNISGILTQRYGENWSHEIVEHSVENNEVRVRCKLTVNDVTHVQFGTARNTGNIGIALQRATENALARCYRELVPDLEVETDDPHVSPLSRIREISSGPTQAQRLRAISRSQMARQKRRDKGIDTITLDLIENALKNALQEMDAVLLRSAISPAIREQRDESSMITDHKGRMVAGQFGSYIAEMLRENSFDFSPGDVILQSDPYKCSGAVSHINDWIVLVPIFHEGTLVGFSSMFGHIVDVGGPVAGSMSVAASSIFGEGLKIPPIKIYDQGNINQAALDLVLNNTRTPEMNSRDLMAIVAGSRAGEARVLELCDRFGRQTYLQVCERILSRTRQTMKQLIIKNLPTEPQSFEDFVDDDGCGNGPFKMKLTVWREEDNAYFDWTGTSDQAPGAINCYLHEGMFKMFVGAYMMTFEPQMALNEGFYDLIHVTMPKGSLVQPKFPAALGGRAQVLARQFDVLAGLLAHHDPETSAAAGYGTRPQFHYSGVDEEGNALRFSEILFGGIPGRPVGDGIDGHSLSPTVKNIPTETLENDYPIVIERYASVCDSGGAGKHRGGNGLEKVYRLLEPGEISIQDDRHRTQPWGLLGGKPGACSEKWIVHKDGARKPLPSKVDQVPVYPGDRIIFRTAGAGGWGDPLERDAEAVCRDVARRLVSVKSAEDDYGVIINRNTLMIDLRSTEELRQRMKSTRAPLGLFDFGKNITGEWGRDSSPLPVAWTGTDRMLNRV